ncbi:MarR family transcriptional regulator [Sinomicrobium pectinilyticum]|uniref:MarR family transcriptional regulator n=1 Tax=Sinomicrobium pectinilyticum TaxID=1084421 RepID=A0A3N0D0I0_SINP1|nr:MarR family winged helix-turn-helix transcriptional regulator [Sinomicrobium pectinilyticum]RNL69165.1 MarR family transcriptional regulator [Sinomicrobium pectinilyticum]
MDEKKDRNAEVMQVFREKGPIGYWVKKTNDTFSNVTRKTTSHGNFNRLEWQFLNLINEKKDLPVDEAAKLLDFFMDQSGMEKLVKRFEAQNLIRVHRHHIFLTEKGKQAYEEVLQIQEQIIANALENVSPEAYTTCIETLQIILKNLRPYTL